MDVIFYTIMLDMRGQNEKFIAVDCIFLIVDSKSTFAAAHKNQYPLHQCAVRMNVCASEFIDKFDMNSARQLEPS